MVERREAHRRAKTCMVNVSALKKDANGVGRSAAMKMAMRSMSVWTSRATRSGRLDPEHEAAARQWCLR